MITFEIPYITERDLLLSRTPFQGEKRSIQDVRLVLEEDLLHCTRYQSPVRRRKTMETMIGKVIHYYPKISVAAVILEDHIAQGDRIHIRGPHDDVYQSVNSLEIEHVPIKEADRGQDVGIRVTERVHPGDVVFREI